MENRNRFAPRLREREQEITPSRRYAQKSIQDPGFVNSPIPLAEVPRCEI